MQDNISLPWFRLYSEIVDNIKIRMIDPQYRWYFVAIMACKCQNIVKGDADHVERVLMIKLGIDQQTLHEIRDTLLAADLIDETYTPIGWSERQYKSDHSTQRSRKFYAKKKEESQTEIERSKTVRKTESKRPLNGSDTDTDTDTDTETEVNKLLTSLKIDNDLWKDYLSMRKRLKAQNTPRGLRTLLHKIEKHVQEGENANELIEAAYSNGWKSVYPQRKRAGKSATKSVIDNNW